MGVFGPGPIWVCFGGKPPTPPLSDPGPDLESANKKNPWGKKGPFFGARGGEKGPGRLMDVKKKPPKPCSPGGNAFWGVPFSPPIKRGPLFPKHRGGNAQTLLFPLFPGPRGVFSEGVGARVSEIHESILGGLAPFWGPRGPPFFVILGGDPPPRGRAPPRGFFQRGPQKAGAPRGGKKGGSLKMGFSPSGTCRSIPGPWRPYPPFLGFLGPSGGKATRGFPCIWVFKKPKERRLTPGGGAPGGKESFKNLYYWSPVGDQISKDASGPGGGTGPRPAPWGTENFLNPSRGGGGKPRGGFLGPRGGLGRGPSPSRVHATKSEGPGFDSGGGLKGDQLENF